MSMISKCIIQYLQSEIKERGSGCLRDGIRENKEGVCHEIKGTAEKVFPRPPKPKPRDVPSEFSPARIDIRK